MKEFKSIEDKGRLRQNWIDSLCISELRIIKDGFEKALPWKAPGTWLYYTEELILKKTEENRIERLKQIGI